MNFNKAVFSERLRAARKNKDITQSELEGACGVAQSAISVYENGEKSQTPNLEDAVKIADVLNVSLNWLCGLDDSEQTITPVQWLIYMDKLLNNPPTINNKAMISESGQGKTVSIQFCGKDMEEFFSAYHAIRTAQKALQNDLYISVVKKVFEQYEYLFKPGCNIAIQGAEPANPPKY